MQGGPVSARRLGVHYVILVGLVAAVVATAVSVGTGKHAQKAIAGGYDVVAGGQCVGPKLDIAQSGRYVNVSNAQSTVGGSLLFEHGRLTGTIHCAAGGSEAIDATVAAGGIVSGTLGGHPLLATLKRDPPAPGSPKPLAPNSVDGSYAFAPASTCLGGSMVLREKGRTVNLISQGKSRGKLAYHAGALTGTIACERGGTRQLVGAASGLTIGVMLTPPAAAGPAPVAAVAPPEDVQATKQRTADQTVVAFFLAIIVVMLFARLCGSLMPRIGQPRVMGEVLAGILLGPTAFGAIDPHLQAKVFASDIVPYINVAANLGLIFYMFLIGMEVDFAQLRGRVRVTLAISNTALAVPMMLGLLAAIPLYEVLAPPTRFLAFALFVGVSMSITAFPVLARIISERRMLKRPLGALALSAAAVDDVSAWFLIALASAVAGAGTALGVFETIGWAAVFCLVMGFLVRPVLARAAVAYDELGRLPGTWITAIFAGVLLSAVMTDTIGIAVIFGAFVMGVTMPRHAGMSEDVTRRVEDFVLTLLLPLFFAYTGLRTDVGLLNRGVLVLIMLGLVALAILGKYGGTLVAARVVRLPWRESAALGALMNTRGLTELIVLNLALSMGVISSALFTALVIMALVTTFMAGPILRLLDPRNEFGEPPEVELAAAVRHRPQELAEVTGGSVLVAPQTESALAQLLELAEPLAHSAPPRELIIARLVRPPRGSAIRGGLQTEARALQQASEQVQRERTRLVAGGIAARAIALTSADPGKDLTRLSRTAEVSLVLIDGRRPLLGDGVPREGVGDVLRQAPCDVAVLVAREGVRVAPSPGDIVMVPFGGADHDWAALEFAASVAAATRARLHLLGAGAHGEAQRDASALLANASLLVQQFSGVVAEPVLATPGREGVLAAASQASLLVIGLSERWQKEGLGETRRAIARSAPAPIVFVRRGERTRGISPVSEMTRFGWSSGSMGWSGGGGSTPGRQGPPARGGES
jgi:Kef-type K+ transport system membrane component KefB